MRAFLLALLLSLTPALMPTLMQAQQSKSTILTQITTNLPDNTTNQITPAGVRSVLNNIVNSYVDFIACTSQGGIVYWNATPAPTCLASGAVNTVLTSNGLLSNPSWKSPNISPFLTAPVTITVPSNSITQGLVINAAGTAGGFPPTLCGKPLAVYNGICINGDNAAHGTGFSNDFGIVHLYGGSSLTGNPNGIFEWLIQTAASSASNTFRDYVAVAGISDTRSGDGGTNTGAGALGSYFGMNAQVRWSATNLAGTTAMEFDNYGSAAGTTKYNWGLNIVSFNSVQGASSDAAVIIYSGGSTTSDSITYGPGVGFHQGISFAEISANGLSPVDSGATVIGTHLETLTHFNAATGIDFTKFTFSGNAWQSNNYSVTQGGFVNIGPNTIADSVPLSIVNQANAASVTQVTGTINNLHIAGADASNNQLVFDSFGGGNVSLVRRADGTAASRTGLVNGDTIGNFQGEGWTSAAAYSGVAVAVAFTATETWSGTANGTSIKLRTTKNTTTTVADSFIVDGFGHFQFGSIAITSLTTCGTGSVIGTATDSTGTVTATGATACTVNFGNNYASAPNCVVSDNTTAAALKVVPATGSFTVSGLTSGDTFTYFCPGKVGL